MTKMIKTENRILQDKFEFRSIRKDEAEQTAEMEVICFESHEVCEREDMIARVEAVPEMFLVAADRETGMLAGFLNGIATRDRDFRDDFFTDPGLHDPDGENVMLVGLEVLPGYRGQGLAAEIMKLYAERERERGRKRLVLTCHTRLVEMYSKMGFSDLGKSASEWGGEKWHEMEMLL